MSDLYGNPYGAQNYSSPYGPTQLTEYEQQLDPIFDAEMQQEIDKRKRLQPLQWIFDILRRPQYVSANVADEIAKAIVHRRDPNKGDALEPGDVLRAVWEGITGERKGSYENVLRDTLEVGTRKPGELLLGHPIFQKEGTRRAQWDWADINGFLLDIFADPSTYVTFGGASKGAQVAADAFAENAVRLMAKNLAQNPEQLGKIAQRGGRELLESALSAKNVDKALRTVAKQQDNLGRLLSQTYREAQTRALNRTAEQLPGLAQELVGRVGGSDIGDLVQRISAGDFATSGNRFKMRIGGKELGVGEATQFADWRRTSWEQFKNTFAQKPGVTNLRNAVWSAMHRGPVGAIRQAIGFRDPYQKLIRNIEREQGEFAVQRGSIERARELWGALSGVDEKDYDLVRNYIVEQEDLVKAMVSPEGASLERMLATGAEADDAVKKAAYNLQETLTKQRIRRNQIAQELGESELDHRQWYLPEVFRATSGDISQTAGRKYTFGEQMQKESRLLQFVFGVDQELADRAVQSNLGAFSTDLKELLAAQALRQAKVEHRYNLINAFKEFGINMSEFPESMRKAATVAGNEVLDTPLKLGGRDITQLGLRQIDHPALKDYLFDYDVASVFDRALKASGSERGKIAKVFHAYMSWWKGMVLLTSGYTMRNFYSNTMTQFMRHGTRSFNPKELQQSIAAVVYAGRKSNPQNFTKALDALGKDDGWLMRMLNTPVGDGTMLLRDVADEAYRRGVIGENLMAFEAKSIADRVSGKTGGITEGFRKINGFMENVPRFQSFLIDVADNGTSKESMDWAGRQARQWFIDYGDLTAQEQKYMKNLVPFYTWIRKNLANQVNGIALYPELYALVPKTEEFLTYEDPNYDPELIPEWMRNEGMFAIGKVDEGLFRMFRPDFAYTDINMLPFEWSEDRFLPYFSFDELKADMINATAPWIRDVAARMTTENGYNYFYREELGPSGDAPYLMRLAMSRPGTIAFVNGLLSLIGVPRERQFQLDEEGKLQIDARMAQTLETYIPVLRQAEMLFYVPNAVIPGWEDWIEARTGAVDDYDGTEQTMQLISYYLGIKTKEADLEKEKERLGWDIYYRSTDLLSELRQQQPGYELRSQTARDRTRESIRRLSR